MSHRSFRPRRRKLLFALGAAVCATTIPVNAAEVAFDIHIDNGRVPDNMRRLRVSQGDLVHLRFIADQPLTLHLHGYDIERQVAPGKVEEMTFAARATGRFPVHVHGAGGDQGSSEEAPLLYVEVYPR